LLEGLGEAAMKRIVCVLVAGASVVAAAAAQETGAAAVAGAATFKTYCSSCHGKEGKGDGPIADSLRYAPPDLTSIAKRNKGKFPADKVFRMIDGREPVKGHGGTDMPVWGDAFLATHDGYDAAKVQAKITDLVAFLESIQTEAAK
jgi:mono/diheme cytochrome c family protein